MYAFVNDELIEWSKARVHISDLALHRGYGVFDFFKIQDGHVFFLNDYLDRFWHSASVMRLPIPLDRPKVAKAIYRLVEKNALKVSGIKLVLTGGYSSDGYTPGQPNLIMTHHELTLPPQRVFDEGVSIITHEYVREFAEAKTINYTMGIWLAEKVKAANAYDVLYVKENLVSEFPRCNFFIVRQDGTIVTPKENVLAGITRKNVLNLGRATGNVEEGKVTLEDVYNAREAFLTSTTKRIVPIVRVNNQPISDGKPGSTTIKLLDGLIDLENTDQSENAYPKKFYGF